ncbi:methyltransferase LaeA [Halenospora varia]|nr:methyltransferase LaeA [Halenospora varia]
MYSIQSAPTVRAPDTPVPVREPGDYIENGRVYHAFHKGKYLFPCDEVEMDRLDIYHKFFQVARGDVLPEVPILHSAPIPEHAPRILDLGTGTGIWAIDMAETPELIGIDLSYIQPQQIPPSVTYQKRDFEFPWAGLGEDSWDLIHMRMLNGSVTSWAQMYAKAFRHLKPQTGYIEHVEIDMVPRCDDGTLPPDSALVNWTRYIQEAMSIQNMPIAYNQDTKLLLEKAGFVDVREQRIMVPYNPWPTDPHLKELGRWYKLGFTQALEALTLAPLTRNLQWTKTDVDRLIQDTKRELCSERIHAHCNMHIWIARRPA